jgi:hypothetical protein
MKNIKLFILLAAFFGISLSSCVNDEFDVPPVAELPNITANASLSDILALHTIGATPTLIEGDLVVDAIVGGDDKTGNIYKNLFVQDETGGIQIRIDLVDFYNTYPVGRKVYIRCQGLYVGDYSGTPQLTISEAGGIIPEILVSKYIVAGARDQTVPVKVKKITELTAADLNTRVTLENVQFSSADAGQTYADAANSFSLNRTLEDCSKNAIIVRSSGYSNFANDLTPTGNGTLTALYTVFGTTKQLVISSLDDIQMTDERCTASEQLMSLGDVRGLFTGSTTSMPNNTRIIGTVISDKDAVNITGANLVLQDGDRGIVVRFSATHSFAMGDQLQIIVSGNELSEYNGLLQINNVPLANAEKIGTASVTPRVATIAQINANAEAWESTLVKINNATLSGGSTYSGNRTVNDGTGSLTMFTRSQATFSGASLPSGTVSVTAYVSQFNSYQINIRNTGDIQ